MRFKICLLALLTLCLTGCTVESDRIYTVCKVENNMVYCYNDSGEFFLVNGGKVIPCPGVGLQAKPKLALYLPESTEFNLTKKIPSVYEASLNDTLCYISKVMQETGAVINCPVVDWKSFTAYVKGDTFDMKVIYSNDETVRVYMNDANGNAVVPLYLE